MKYFIKILIATSMTMLLMPVTVSAEESLTIVSWGGAYTKSQDEAYHKPYLRKTGVKVKNIDKGSAAVAGVESQVKAGKVTWDLVDVIEPDAISLCDKGLVERIDHNKILSRGINGSKPSEDFVAGLSECFIPTIIYSTLFAYNKNAFGGKAPQTIKDVFDLKKFPGKRALEKQAYNNLEWALIADGVPTKDVYEVLSTKQGVDRAFKKLDTIKDQVIWWTAGAQTPQLLADKEVVIGTSFNGRFFDAIVTEEQPIEIMWHSQSVELDGWVVPKGKLTQKVKDYLYFATDSQRLADQAKYISYGPLRKSSEKLVGKHYKTGVDMSPHMPTTAAHMKYALVKSVSFWIDNKEDLTERFNAWLVK